MKAGIIRKIITVVMMITVLFSSIPAYAEGQETEITKIQISGTKYLVKGKKTQLSAIVYPESVSQNVVWKSSDTKIATVNKNGIVKGKKAGKVTITAVSKEDSRKKKTFKITVFAKPVKKIQLENKKLFIDLRTTKKYKLKATALPAGSCQKFIWESSNKDVADINSKGVIQPKKTGKTTITVASTDGTNKKVSYTVYVTNSMLTQANLDECYTKNIEFVAWLKIPGTEVNYPVVWSDNIEYYLNYTFEGKRSSLGTLFSLGRCDWSKPSKNLAIYGHDVEGSGKRMFKKLLDYKSEAFYKEHKYIYLDSIYGPGKYEVFAAFDITVGDLDLSVSTFGSNKEFKSFVNKAKAKTPYITTAKVKSSDKIISLVTCDRYFKRHVGRFIVMAKKVN